MLSANIPHTDPEYQELVAVLQNKKELSPQKQQQLQLEEQQQQQPEKHEASNDVVKCEWKFISLSLSLR